MKNNLVRKMIIVLLTLALSMTLLIGCGRNNSAEETAAQIQITEIHQALAASPDINGISHNEDGFKKDLETIIECIATLYKKYSKKSDNVEL